MISPIAPLLQKHQKPPPLGPHLETIESQNSIPIPHHQGKHSTSPHTDPCSVSSPFLSVLTPPPNAAAETMGFCCWHCILFLFTSMALLAISNSSTLDSDLNALLAFRYGCDRNNLLATWNNNSNPCSFSGVACSNDPLRVTRLVLENLSLTGHIPASLTNLDELRVLSLKSNNFTGPIPDISPSLPHLKLLFLSHNSLSGSIPSSLPSNLYRLDLSYNDLAGVIDIASLPPRLITLRLNDNRLSGTISGLSLSLTLQELNLSSNMLFGAIPISYSSFPASAFAGNPGLCGAPLSTACANIVSDPAADSPVPPAVVSSFPSANPQLTSSNISSSPIANQPPSRAVSRRMSPAAISVIVVADFTVLLIVSGLLFCYFWRKYAAGRSPSRLQEGEKIVYSSSPYPAAAGGGCGDGEPRGRMVFVEEARRFELEDLLRASAEMLGKGGYGTAYKAVLDDGSVVAVKRLRDVHVGGKREFEQNMEALGRLRHPNLVPLKAYYYARDEKLLVYEFMPNGSLFAALHGNRGPGRTPLDWTARMRIAVGAARGLAFIHQASTSPKLLHGSVKSTNVLLDAAGNALLADVGLALLGPAAAAGRCGGYRAPETPPVDGRRAWSSKRADVYAFGVVLLELLTGRPADGGGVILDLPQWVASVVREEWTAEVFDLELMRFKGIEEEMVGMLQVAMACTVVSPDQRPGIGQVLRTIEELRGDTGDNSPSHDSIDSVSDSTGVSDDGAGGGN